MIKYIAFDDYKRKWIFTHQSMPICSKDKDAIKPMSEYRSHQIWREHISKVSFNADHFDKEDWPLQANVWQHEIDWQTAWEKEQELPIFFEQHFPWQDNHVIYFCYDKNNIIETQWGMFKKYWKNFLFYDDNPLLLGKKRKEVAMFEQTGLVKLGLRFD